MAEFRPLRAIRYDPGRVGDLTAVVAPPYDVISAAQAAKLHARSPHNVVRLILNREADPHAAAARELRSWLDEGVLIEDRTSALYFYSQTFELPGHGLRRRDGIIGAMRLEDIGSGRVCPHEHTFAGPKADRLGLMRACAANLSPIFGLICRAGLELRDVVAPAIGGTPLVEITDPDEGVRHQVWPLSDPAVLAACADVFREETVVIADGHHRYETALEFRDQMRCAHPGAGPDAPFESILTCISNAAEPGVVVLPTHRVLPQARPADVQRSIAAVGDAFDVSTYRVADQASFLAEFHRGGGRIGCVLPDALLVLAPRADIASLLPGRCEALRRLAVIVLHEVVFPRLPAAAIAALDYTHVDAAALAVVAEGRAGAAFLVTAPTAEEVRAVCLTGETLPQKTTYFYPKLLSGLVFRSLAV